jgi:membrane-bound lytic murein transglycosylase D
MKTLLLFLFFVLNCLATFAQKDLTASDSSAIDSLINHFSTKVLKSQNPDTHIVSYGETIYSIAKKYMISANELLMWNRLDKNSVLDRGQVLMLNPPPTSRLSKENIPITIIPADKIHTVSYGEYPYLIAKKYNISPNDLLAWNNMDENARVDYGDKLWLINPNDSSINKEGFAERVTLNTPVPRSAQHEVGEGDTIYAIAQKYGISPNNLLKWNKLTIDIRLGKGQKLWLKKPEGEK